MFFLLRKNAAHLQSPGLFLACRSCAPLRLSILHPDSTHRLSAIPQITTETLLSTGNILHIGDLTLFFFLFSPIFISYSDNSLSFLCHSFITPVLRRGPEVPSSAVAAHRAGPAQQPFTPQNQAPPFHTPQVQHLLPLLFAIELMCLCIHCSLPSAER